MANWSQSHFLQSLGWATLNSFWQMALLWCIFLCISYTFKISSRKKYQLSVLAIMIGFGWFVINFFYFFQSSSVSTIALFDQTINESNNLLDIFLISASIAYLSLLIFPSYRLFKNWKFVQRIKKDGLCKADLTYRLFVQKVAAQMGIAKKVMVYVSEIVNSPVTVGYLKPIILIPVAAFNNLTTQQVEAILLHELSHIKRYDYLVNLVISVINTLLYFNPFVKQFMRTIEAERENCCDQLVLQFGYDRIGYASALLTLEKISSKAQILAIAATGKKYLLNRIEKIVGMEKKKGFKINQFAGVLAALFCVIAFNSILIIKEQKQQDYSLAYSDIANPFSIFNNESGSSSATHFTSPAKAKYNFTIAGSTKNRTNENSHFAPVGFFDVVGETTQPSEPVEAINQFVHVAQDDVDASLTIDQKDKVKTTVAATKKVVTTLQWQEVEAQIADAMTRQEKARAKQEYMKQADESVNWKNVENNLRSKYNELDWEKINSNINNALTVIQLDSLQKSYNTILTQLEIAHRHAKAKVPCTPIPDASIEQIRKAEEQYRLKVDSLKALRVKKVVRL